MIIKGTEKDDRTVTATINFTKLAGEPKLDIHDVSPELVHAVAFKRGFDYALKSTIRHMLKTLGMSSEQVRLYTKYMRDEFKIHELASEC